MENIELYCDLIKNYCKCRNENRILKKILPRLKEELENFERKKLNNLTRVVDGEKMMLDEAFERFVSNDIWLDRFPVLTIEYKSAEQKLVKKTYAEVESDFNKYRNGEISYLGNKEEIEVLCESVLKKIARTETLNDNFKTHENITSKKDM